MKNKNPPENMPNDAAFKVLSQFVLVQLRPESQANPHLVYAVRHSQKYGWESHNLYGYAEIQAGHWLDGYMHRGVYYPFKRLLKQRKSIPSSYALENQFEPE